MPLEPGMEGTDWSRFPGLRAAVDYMLDRPKLITVRERRAAPPEPPHRDWPPPREPDHIEVVVVLEIPPDLIRKGMG